ncbi:10129_t:CDS:1 [Funneliformis mosseae]|uniref:10129_t:CDS:1 n=1 Tax=Funneliformis mosseae TaxID=27381 RepID=A0A9N9DCN7_FUNMO|nr:10129_t:CDS:1 [Funneliformis mosseae]
MIIRLPIISIEGLFFHYSGSIALPIYERQIFNTVYSGMFHEKSYIIHGPYQSGKFSFVIALKESLIKNNIVPAHFDMIDLKGTGFDMVESQELQMTASDLFKLSLPIKLPMFVWALLKS